MGSTPKVKPSSDAARNRMKAVRRRGTLPERALWEALESLGLEFERNVRPETDLRREADVVFWEERIAVFVDGCFWHGCPLHGTLAKANAEFWKRKIERNKERDADTNAKLLERGWTVIRIWEHVDPVEAARVVAKVVEEVREGDREGKPNPIVIG